jgi:hypothetical protein
MHVAASLAESGAESAPLSEPPSAAAPVSFADVASPCAPLSLPSTEPALASAAPPSAGPGLPFEVAHAMNPTAMMTTGNQT